MTTFDVCLQDDANPSTVLLFNSQSGDYRFCCGGTVFTGRGKVRVQGCTISLEQVTGFGIFMAKAVLSGRGDELIDLAKTNLFR